MIAVKVSDELQNRRLEDAAYAYCGGEFRVAFVLYSELVDEGVTSAKIGLECINFRFAHIRKANHSSPLRRGVKP